MKRRLNKKAFMKEINAPRKELESKLSPLNDRTRQPQKDCVKLIAKYSKGKKVIEKGFEERVKSTLIVLFRKLFRAGTLFESILKKQIKTRIFYQTSVKELVGLVVPKF